MKTLPTQLITFSDKQKALARMTDVTLLTKREELKAIIAESEKLLDTVNEEFKTRIAEKGSEDKLAVGGGTVYLVKKPIFRNVTLEVAAKLDALKTVVDTTKLSALAKEGKKIKGLEYSKYVMVR